MDILKFFNIKTKSDLNNYIVKNHPDKFTCEEDKIQKDRELKILLNVFKLYEQRELNNCDICSRNLGDNDHYLLCNSCFDLNY